MLPTSSGWVTMVWLFGFAVIAFVSGLLVSALLLQREPY